MVSYLMKILIWFSPKLFVGCNTDMYNDPPKLHKIGIIIEDNLLNSLYCPNKMENASNCASNSWHMGDVQFVYRSFQKRDFPQMQKLVSEMKEENVTGLVSFSMCDSQRILHQILMENELPHLPVPPTYCFRYGSHNGRSPWRLRNRASHLISAILAVIIKLKTLNLKEIIVFMDGTFGIDQTSALLLGLSDASIRFLAYQVNYTSKNYKKELKKLSVNVERTFYLLLTYGKGAHQILVSAKEMELIRFNTIWILGNLDTNLDSLHSLGLDDLLVNVLLFKKPCIPPTATPDTNQVGLKMSMTDGFLLETVSRYLSDCLNITETEYYPSEAWQTELFFPMTELDQQDNGANRVLLDPEQNLDERYDIFRLDISREYMDLKRVGEWCVGFGLLLLSNDIFPSALPGLGNQILKIGTLPISPYIMKHIEGNTIKWTGFCIDILDGLSIDMNFKYEITEPEDKMFGSFDNDTGNWTGIIRQAMRNEIDIGIGPITLTAERFNVIDYTHPFTEDGVGFVMKRMVDDGMAINMIFRPFEAIIWCLLPCVILLTGVVLTLVNRLSMRIKGGKPETDINCSFYQNLWFMFGATVHQAQSNEPKNISARLIIVFWWVFVILLSTYYTAFLAAFLTVSISQSRINSLKDLSQEPSIQPITLAGSTWSSYFLQSNKPDYRKIGIAIQKSRNETEISKIMEMVRTGHYAFVMDSSVAAYFTGIDPDIFSYVEERGYKQSLGFITPKGSRIRELLSYNIIKSQEAGLVEKLRSQWWNTTKQKTLRKSVNQDGLTLNDLGGAFIVVLSAAGFGIIFSIIERLTLCYKRRKTFHTKKQSIICKYPGSNSVSLQNFENRYEKTLSPIS